MSENNPWQVKIGGGVSLQFTEAEIQDDATGVITSADDFTGLPYAHLHVGYELSRRWLLFAEADGIALSGDEYLNALGEVRYRIDGHWDVGLGYRYYFRDVDSSDFKNKLAAHLGVFSIGYSF